MMNKDIFDIYNDIDIDLNSYEKQNLTEIEIKKYGKNFFKKLRKNRPNKIRNKLIAVAVSIVLIFGFSKSDMGRDIYGKIMNLIDTKNYSSIDSYRYIPYSEEIIKYINQVNEVVESNGIKVKISEIIIDRDRIFVSYLIEIGDKINELPKLYSVYGNNMIAKDNYGVNMNSQLNFVNNNINGSLISLNHEILDYKEGIFGGVLIYESLEIPSDKIVDIEINIDKIELLALNESSKFEKIELKGNWNFDITVDRTKLVENTKIVELNEKIKIDNIEFKLDEFIISPITKSIRGSAIIDGKNIKDLNSEEFNDFIRKYAYKPQVLFLDGRADIGKRIVFELRVVGQDIVFDYIGYGEPINDFDSMKTSIEIHDWFKNMGYIDLTPYIVKDDYKSNYRREDIYIGNEIIDSRTEIKYDKGEPFRIYLNK